MGNILDRFKLDGKVAIVSGSGKGIGKATAIALAQAGADVVCSARTVADIEKTAEAVRAQGHRALAVRCDVLDTSQLENLVAATLEEFGRIDILVNNAGGFVPSGALKISESRFEKTLRFNLTSCFLLIKMAVPEMVKTAGSGAVVNISSGASRMMLGGFAPYGAAKAGLNQMTRILGCEFAPKVRVNGIIVGYVPTPGHAVVNSEEMNKAASANIPMGRGGHPEDIAAGVVYLASPASQWMTGEMIEITGGAHEPAMKYPTEKL